MKRHERPYACTFTSCNKMFGCKDDWKRHENSQHFHLESWRCSEERLDGEGICARNFYRRQQFRQHLAEKHNITDTKIIMSKLDQCRLGNNCQTRFWCGSCTMLIDLRNKGLDAWTERFDHIDDHFMGSNGFPQTLIAEWVPIDSDKPQGANQSSNIFSDSLSIRSRSESPLFCNRFRSWKSGPRPEFFEFPLREILDTCVTAY